MKKITDPQILHDEIEKLGFKETTFEEFEKYKQYSLEGDKDPRWKLKFRVYQQNDDFVVIFEKDGIIYSSKRFGWPQPKELEMLLINEVEWSEPESDEEY